MFRDYSNLYSMQNSPHTMHVSFKMRELFWRAANSLPIKGSRKGRISSPMFSQKAAKA
jgi:hypothetical protein